MGVIVNTVKFTNTQASSVLSNPSYSPIMAFKSRGFMNELATGSSPHLKLGNNGLISAEVSNVLGEVA